MDERAHGALDAARDLLLEMKDIYEEKELPPPPQPKLVDQVALDSGVEATRVNLTRTIESDVVEVVRPAQENPPVPEKDLRGYARLHFGVVGYSEMALNAANAKSALWLSRSGLKDGQLTDAVAKKTLRTIWEIYADRWKPSTWFERFKLRAYDFAVKTAPTLLTGALLLTGLTTTLLVRNPKAKTVGAVLSLTSVSLLPMVVSNWKKKSLLRYPCPRLVDYCTGTVRVDAPISEDAKVTVSPSTNCQSVGFSVGFTISPGKVWIPRLCTHNELNALVYRQLLPKLGTPESRSRKWQLGLKVLKEKLPPLEIPNDYDDDKVFEIFIMRLPLARRNAMSKAMVLLKCTLTFRDCRTKAFVKREWLVGKELAKRNPRLISGKSDEYLCETGPYYYLWMKMMCASYWPDMNTILTSKFIYTGGLTGDQIGTIFNYYVRVLGWEVIEGDFSRYDGHNEVEALDAEMGYYSSVFDDNLLEAMRRQLETYGKTANGHKFSCKGKVASGVINTSFGNTIRGFMVVAAWAHEIKYDDYVVMQLGDDNIIFVKSVQKFDLSGFTQHCGQMGHKLEAVHRPDPDYAEFCSQRFWDIGSTYVLGPKPARVLAKTFITHDPTLEPLDMPSYCKEIAVGFRNYNWIPVLGVVVDKWASYGGPTTKATASAVARELASQFHRVQLRTTLDVDRGAVLAQFCKIYGFDPRILELQLADTPLETGVAYWSELLESMCETDGVGTAAVDYIEVVEIGRKCFSNKIKRTLNFL